MNRIFNLIFIIGIAAIAMHCSNDTAEKEQKVELQKDQLTGHWQVISAVRDDKPTKLLNNTTFHFMQDSMSTNLPTQEKEAAYSWADNEIIRQSDDITTYTVHTLNSDSLEFSVELQGFNFDMTLVKATKDSIE